MCKLGAIASMVGVLLLAIDSQYFIQANPSHHASSSKDDRDSDPPIPTELYDKWRKYGAWDYKQQAAKYYEATQFNFGATAAAAGFDKPTALALAQAFMPTRKDIDAFDPQALETNFSRHTELFDRLRTMAEEDSRVIRIAPDFTWLTDNSGWPRNDLGFTERRWKEYRSMFKRLLLQEGILRSEDFPGAIFFIAQSRGLCIGGSSSGYVFSTRSLTPVVTSPKDALDKEAKTNQARRNAQVFTHLKTSWYAFYQVDW